MSLIIAAPARATPMTSGLWCRPKPGTPQVGNPSSTGQPAQFLVEGAGGTGRDDWRPGRERPRPRRLAAGMGDGGARFGTRPVAGKRIGRQIDDPHHQRPIRDRVFRRRERSWRNESREHELPVWSCPIRPPGAGLRTPYCRAGHRDRPWVGLGGRAVCRP